MRGSKRRNLRNVVVLLAAGLGLGLGSAAGGCAYHGHGYGYYGGHCGPDPVGAAIVGTAAIFYAIGSSCH